MTSVSDPYVRPVAVSRTGCGHYALGLFTRGGGSGPCMFEQVGAGRRPRCGEHDRASEQGAYSLIEVDADVGELLEHVEGEFSSEHCGGLHHLALFGRQGVEASGQHRSQRVRYGEVVDVGSGGGRS